MAKKNDYISIPICEYEALIECRTHMNALYGFITKLHTRSIRNTGIKANLTSVSMIELVSGYDENERYFESLKKEFRKKEGKENENDFKVNTP
nr:MAG TPA: hypothetical protein [Bacteriophage sp.]